MLQLVLQHDEAVGLQVEGELLFGLHLFLLWGDGLLVEVVLGIGGTGEHGLRGRFLQAESAEVDVGTLGIGTGIAELYVETAGLDIENDGLSVVYVGLWLYDTGGVALEADAVAIEVPSGTLAEELLHIVAVEIMGTGF